MIQASEKQLESIEKMCRALGKIPEDKFKDYKELNDYFTNLMEWMKKLKKKINFDKAVKNWHIDLQKIKDKREKYYNENPENLRFKAIEYQKKYNASKQKTIAFMRKKTSDMTVINKVIEEIDINEELIIGRIIEHKRNYEGKDFYKIKSWLINKQFDKDIIDKLIEELKEEEANSECNTLLEDTIETKVRNLVKQGISKSKIKQKLYAIGHQEIVNKYIEEYYTGEEESEKIEREIEREKNKGTDKYKIINKLLKKGYNYQLIQKYI